MPGHDAAARVEQIEEIGKIMLGYKDERFGSLQHIQVLVKAKAKDWAQTIPPEDIEPEHLDASGHLVFLLSFEKTEATFTCEPYVTATAPPHQVASWIKDIVQEAPMPPDLQ